MKKEQFGFTIKVSVPVSTIKEYADDCGADYKHYLNGLKESIREEIELSLESYNKDGCSCEITCTE